MRKLYIAVIGFTLLLSDHFSAQAQYDSSAKNAAFLIFDGVQIIDFTGPFEVLGYGFNVFTVSEKMDTITTNMGMKVIPNYNFKNCPRADVVIVPGGYGVRKSVLQSGLINWIKEQSNKATVIMSVCNGAFLLAKAGLLDSLEVTTTSPFIDSLQRLVPSARVVRDKRFVDNGKIITTAGLSSGIDGALHLSTRLLGPAYGSLFARWMEYNWQPDSKYTAATLANCNTLNIERLLLFGFNGQPVKYEGDTRHWDFEISIHATTSLDSVVTKLNQIILDKEKWSLVKSGTDGATFHWLFVGKDKMNWTGISKVVMGKERGEYDVSVSIRQMIQIVTGPDNPVLKTN